MSIASEITRINNNIASAYTAIGTAGGTVPASANSANLATAIGTIPRGGGAYTENFIKVGTPSINSDFIASGFTATSYIEMPNAMPSTNYELVFAINTNTDHQGNIFAGRDDDNNNLYIINRYISFWNGSSTASGSRLDLNKKYWIKIVYNGTNTIFYTIEDRAYAIETLPATSSWTTQITKSGNVFSGKTMCFGNCAFSTAFPYSGGNIYMGDTILYVGGVESWRAIKIASSGYTELPNYQVVNGVASQRSGALTGSEFSNITSVDDYGFYQTFNERFGLTGLVSFPSLTAVGERGFHYAFTKTGVTSISFTNPMTVGVRGFYFAFNSCTDLETADLSGITSIDNYGFQTTFSSATSLTSVDLSGLITVGSYGLNSSFSDCSNLITVDLSSLTTVGNYGFDHIFRQCTNLTNINLSSLATVGERGFNYAFQSCYANLASITLSSLTDVGLYGFNYAFQSCQALTTVNLTSLSTIGDYGLYYAFSSCSGLENVYFNSLTTNTFSTYRTQFQSMLQGTGSSKTHTLHFPSNLQTTISGLSGYPNFGGNSGKVTLAFDLPATS